MNTFLTEEAEHEEFKPKEANLSENNNKEINNNNNDNNNYNELMQLAVISNAQSALENTVNRKSEVLNNYEDQNENPFENISDDNNNYEKDITDENQKELIIIYENNQADSQENNILEIEEEKRICITETIKEDNKSITPALAENKINEYEKALIGEYIDDLVNTNGQNSKQNEQKSSENLDDYKSDSLHEALDHLNKNNKVIEENEKHEAEKTDIIKEDDDNSNTIINKNEIEKFSEQKVHEKPSSIINKTENFEQKNREKESLKDEKKIKVEDNKEKVEVKLEIEEDEDNNQIQYDSDEDD